MSEEDRLRRQLRALTAVNRQLQAQLEGSGIKAVASRPGSRSAAPDLLTGPTSTGRIGPVRRGSVGSNWLEQLAALPPSAQSFLARLPDGTTALVEGRTRRQVKSGLLASALEVRFGQRREATGDDVQSWVEGPPVEVLEAPTGPPFVVVGGQRLPLRGLPVPYPVNAEDAAPFAVGSEIDLSPRGLAQAQLRNLMSPSRLIERTRRASERHGGLMPAAERFTKRQLRRLR